jgi:uncharacterized protein (TIGR00251 family)
MIGKISVTVTPNSRNAAVTEVSAREYRVSVHAPARDGKANEAVIEVLAEYFAVPKSRIKIARGHSARKKVVVIE